ncbi:MAG: hypothetical protein ACR2NZ_23055 [Rubripirellula sp.]
MNRHRYPTSVLASLTVTILVLSAVSSGCHRQYYRKQADGEAYCLIDQKAADVARPPNTALRIEVDRRSRMFNPFDLDFQPMPLDDPASYRYMQCVDGRRGYPMWEAAGLTNGAESPDWWQFLPLDDDGVLVLNAENAVRIALLHSPAYQEQLEQLYFVALDVSGERFEFDTQFFGGADAFFETFRGGPSVVGIGDRDMRLRRNFATGGNLLVGLANDIVWNLGDSSVRSTSTLLDFTFFQPLLRNAGRDVILENLTQAERELLASVRAFERFRRSFYLNVTTGNRIETTVQTAVGSISLGPTGFANAGGFLGLLQTELEIRNSKENIARQTENLLILEDSLIELLTTSPDDAAELVLRQRLQVAQARQQLFSSQQTLVSQQAGFQLSVDQFLRTLGLPPYLCVKLDDPILDQFELIDRTLLTRREELSTLRANVGAINVSILERGEFKLDPDTGLPVSQIEWTPELSETLEVLRSELEPLAEFTRDLIENDLPVIQNDIERLAEALPERSRQSVQMKEQYKSEQDSICGLLNVSDIDESIFDTSGLDGLGEELQTEFDKLSDRLDKYLARIEKLQESFVALQARGSASTDPRELAQQLRDDIILASQDLVAEIGDDVLLLQLIQAQARTESVLLPEVDITPEVAFEIARRNRRDYANARAALVDSWRQIEVIADDLESNLDVIVNGSIGSDRLSPGSLTKEGQLRVGLQWDAPITRLLERNAYRQVLILYEQRKRDYYEYEDTVWQVLRAEVRQLQRDRLNFELGRNSVRIAAEQIELNADIRQQNDARGRSGGPTAARDAIQALNDLLRAQNGLLGIFVNYEVVRRNLDLDMGTMELTPEGLWIDPGKFAPESLLQMTGTTVDGLIECGCNDCGLRYNPLPREPEYSTPVYQMSHSEPVTVDGVPVELIPEGDAGSYPTEAMPLQTPLQTMEDQEIPRPDDLTAPSDMPIPTEIPSLGSGLNSPLPPDPMPPLPPASTPTPPTPNPPAPNPPSAQPQRPPTTPQAPTPPAVIPNASGSLNGTLNRPFVGAGRAF